MPLGVAAGDGRDHGRGVRTRGRGGRYDGLLTDEEGVMKTEEWDCSGVARDFSIEPKKLGKAIFTRGREVITHFIVREKSVVENF